MYGRNGNKQSPNLLSSLSHLHVWQPLEHVCLLRDLSVVQGLEAPQDGKVGAFGGVAVKRLSDGYGVVAAKVYFVR